MLWQNMDITNLGECILAGVGGTEKVGVRKVFPVFIKSHIKIISRPVVLIDCKPRKC